MTTILVRSAAACRSTGRSCAPSPPACPCVSARKCCRSDFSRHGSVPSCPITPFSATAATSTICISRAPPRVPRERCKRLAAQAADGPVVHHLGAERLVESDRRRIPVEHRPFEARLALLDAALRQLRHQRLADAAAAECRPHEQILEIDAVPAAERREIEKPDREARRLAVPFGDVAEQPRLRCRTARRRSSLRRRIDLVPTVSRIRRARAPDAKISAASAGRAARMAMLTPPPAALMCGCGS